MATEMPDKAYRKIINSWAMYDWANSAFVTTIMAAMFPLFYRSLAISAGLGEANATAFWAYTTSLALFLIAILASVLGTISDYTGGKKRYIGFFAGLGILATALFLFLTSSKFARIVGPLLFGVVSQAAGGSRLVLSRWSSSSL